MLINSNPDEIINSLFFCYTCRRNVPSCISMQILRLRFGQDAIQNFKISNSIIFLSNFEITVPLFIKQPPNEPTII